MTAIELRDHTDPSIRRGEIIVDRIPVKGELIADWLTGDDTKMFEITDIVWLNLNPEHVSLEEGEDLQNVIRVRAVAMVKDF